MNEPVLIEVSASRKQDTLILAVRSDGSVDVLVADPYYNVTAKPETALELARAIFTANGIITPEVRS